MTIHQATRNDLDYITPLFDGYRMFYRQPSDLEGARHFLKERLQLKDSHIYFALSENKIPAGFMQLYPLFSSVSMQPMYLLNDLYVASEFRGSGVGTALIQVAKDRCRKEGQKGLALQTEVTNSAQQLYEHLGFVKDPDLHYFWKADT